MIPNLVNFITMSYYKAAACFHTARKGTTEQFLEFSKASSLNRLILLETNLIVPINARNLLILIIIIEYKLIRARIFFLSLSLLLVGEVPCTPTFDRVSCFSLTRWAQKMCLIRNHTRGIFFSPSQEDLCFS